MALAAKVKSCRLHSHTPKRATARATCAVRSSHTPRGTRLVAHATDPSTPEAEAARDQMLARIAKARSYNKSSPPISSTSSSPAPAPPPAPAPVEVPVAITEQSLAAQAQAQAQRSSRFVGWADKGNELTSVDTDAAFSSTLLNSTQSAGGGSASQPASFMGRWLDSSEDLDSATMRPEVYTAAKEARMRARGAEILTVDSSYRASENIVSTTRTTLANAQALGLVGDGAQNEDTYQPTVSTWGVFPRPKDISKEFGGGRNIQKGGDVETGEQKMSRAAAYVNALQSYKKAQGLEVDPENERQAQILYEQGMELFGAANLQAAYEKHCQALDLVPLKSRVGGLAGLSKGVILDSQGYSEEAQKLYKQLQGHALPAVSRKSRQLLFGFQASTYLKADTINYSARNADFLKYMRGAVDRTRVWVPTEQERIADEQAARKAALISAAVLLGPLVAILVVIVDRNP
eukprot:CAMPEP_0119109350 /NCGR_PEP_ID=MMETSP1180-20130426/17859_1 /TAXON_ID=3052 ORGANISM="Chlamydomonas cf sp, Strain CCMP681" /NCGR_SAMPLE_ID=MMETSP1180 /ASSEMBLY_ACC=CAM_ASM_000741 /LENGTH=461 /DNA_ID=CAMNT_0007095093 /DNA_START=17 /DNA_END=1402 /DNA_ORIENTATION=+